MSLILDALKRAERERRAGQTPMPLDSLPVAPVDADDSGARRWLLPALVGAIVAGGAVYALLVWRRPVAAPPVTVAVAPVVATAASAPLPGPAATPEAAAPAVTSTEPPALAPSSAAIDDNRIATLDDLVDDHRVPPDAARPPPRTPPSGDSPNGKRAEVMMPRSNTAASPETEALPPFEQPVGPPPPEPLPAPSPRASLPQAPSSAPAPAGAAASETDGTSPPTAGASAAPATNLKDMSPNYRSEFPAFTVDVHVYNDDPQRRFVMLNGKRYHEGDVTAEGPRVVGIVSDAIVFEWRGERVTYSLTR